MHIEVAEGHPVLLAQVTVNLALVVPRLDNASAAIPRFSLGLSLLAPLLRYLFGISGPLYADGTSLSRRDPRPFSTGAA